MNEWELVTLEAVVKLIGNAPNKSCQLDAAPTWLVKQYSGLLAPFIVAIISANCFFQLRQLSRIRRSLDFDCHYIHSCVHHKPSRLLRQFPDWCAEEDDRQVETCPLNFAARIVSNTHKFDHGLTHFRRSQLHWLDVVDRVQFRVCVQVFRCLHKMPPTANPSPAFLVVATCNRLTVVILISHV